MFSTCVFVCLLLVKISKKFASMFVCRFVTCQNFQFWQVCSSDGLSVCMSVCLFVCLSVSSSIQVTVFDISLPNLTQLCIYVT